MKNVCDFGLFYADFNEIDSSINPSSQFSLLMPLKTLENQRFSDVFREIKREHREEKK